MIDSLEKMCATKTKITSTVWHQLHNHGEEEGYRDCVNFYVYLDIFWIAEDEDGICYTEVGMNQHVGTLEEMERFLWNDLVGYEMASKYKSKEEVIICLDKNDSRAYLYSVKSLWGTDEIEEFIGKHHNIADIKWMKMLEHVVDRTQLEEAVTEIWSNALDDLSKKVKNPKEFKIKKKEFKINKNNAL